MDSRRTLLILSQVYVPDPAAVGQHLADAAAAMVRRGWRVVVLTSARGYDDPRVKYPRREVRDGVEIVRLPLSSFGKSSIKVRLLAQTLFLLQATVRGLFLRGLDCVLVSTSPPMAPGAGWLLSLVRRVPVKFWVMDLNPDQMVVMGKIAARSLPARVFDAMNRLVLRRARNVVALDRFMADHVNRKVPVGDRLTVLPPWHHDAHVRRIPHEENAFRREHGLAGKFVVMYSGNHTLANPLTTVLEAAKRLQDDDRFTFVFVGGGQGKAEVEAYRADGVRNVVSLPYQPLEGLAHSLSAADVHVVTLGNAMPGIVHPCKVYGAMAVGRPVLTVGPPRCHLEDLVGRYRLGHHVAHWDVDAAVRALRHLASLTPTELATMGDRGRAATRAELSQESLLARFCNVVEDGFAAPAPLVAPARAEAADGRRGDGARGRNVA